MNTVLPIRKAILDQGYFELPPALPAELVARARADVEAAARAEDAFLADAMWEILGAVLPVAREALAGPVAILPAFWAWRIGPDEQGWSPHRDNPKGARDAADQLAAVTIWVPLTDATTRNGCIHCVPSYWDYGYENPKGDSSISAARCIRALPAAAGSILGWSHALLHWGGRCAPDEPPRIATSFELIREDLADPTAHPATWRPEPSERWGILEAMRAKYAHMRDL